MDTIIIDILFAIGIVIDFSYLLYEETQIRYSNLEDENDDDN